MQKSRTILLMEANFNHSNKGVFGFKILENARRHGFMPEEIYSERNKTTDEGTLARVIFHDIARQNRLSAGLSLGDDAQ